MPSVENDAPAYGPADLYATAGELLATEVGKWIVAKGLDRPKRIIRLIHNESTTSIQWYRNPEKPDGISGMVARHDYEVLIYDTEPTRVFPPAKRDDWHEFTEDVDDASMCVCGVPALTHDAVFPPAKGDDQ